MMKPKRVVLLDGTIVWETRQREAGRKSTEYRRRFSSLKEANDFLFDLKEQQKKRLSGQMQTGSFFSTCFQREAENWLTHIKLRSSPGHYRRVKAVIDDFTKNYGGMEPNKVSLDFLTDLQAKLKDRQGNKKDSVWSNASVNRYTEAICAVLNFAAEQRRIPHSPVTGFKKLPRNSPEMLFWEEQEAGSFLAWASEKYSDLSNESRMKARKNYLAYLLSLNTGMRASEIWGLKPLDLFFADDGSGNSIFVRRQFNGVLQDYAKLKGELVSDKDKSRHVPCPKELRAELEAMIRHNNIRRDAPLFQSVFGNPVNHDSFADRFERDVRTWGGTRIRFHDLRHSAATLMLSKGVDVKTVKEILGHESLTTTMIYVHLLGNRIKQVSGFYSVLPAPVKPKLQLIQGSA